MTAGNAAAYTSYTAPNGDTLTYLTHADILNQNGIQVIDFIDSLSNNNNNGLATVAFSKTNAASGSNNELTITTKLYPQLDLSNSGSYYVTGSATAGAFDVKLKIDYELNDGTTTVGGRSFKSGRDHDFGIVYYDSTGRPGPVNINNGVSAKPQAGGTSTYINSNFERQAFQGVGGQNKIRYDIMHTAPSYAHNGYYRWVYSHKAYIPCTN